MFRNRLVLNCIACSAMAVSSIACGEDVAELPVEEQPAMHVRLFARVNEGETADPLVFSSDAKLAAAPTKKAIYVWKTLTGELVRRITISPELKKAFGQVKDWFPPPTVDFSAEGKSIWAYGYRRDESVLPPVVGPLTLVRFDLLSGALIDRQVYDYPTKDLYNHSTPNIAFSPVRHQLIDVLTVKSKNQDGREWRYRCHDIQRRAVVSQFEQQPPFWSLHFNPGPRALRGSSAVWDLEKQQPIAKFDLELDEWYQEWTALSPCHNYFSAGVRSKITTSNDGRIRTWQINTGKLLGDFIIEDQIGDTGLSTLYWGLGAEHYTSVHATEADRGMRLIVIDAEAEAKYQLRAWDATTGKEDMLFRLQHRPIRNFAVAPSGQSIYTVAGREILRWSLPMNALE